jgi:hypothetical protein
MLFEYLFERMATLHDLLQGYSFDPLRYKTGPLERWRMLSHKGTSSELDHVFPFCLVVLEVLSLVSFAFVSLLSTVLLRPIPMVHPVVRFLYSLL